MKAVAALAVLLALAPSMAAAGEPRGDWRQVVTAADRQRLRNWRTAWMTALADARGGADAATVAADPALFDPDAGLVDGAMPPPGDYRCRLIAIGARPGARALASGGWGRCHIADGGAPRPLTGLDGIQRPAGLIYADSEHRAIFLGTAMFPDERRPATYAHAAGRDMAGVVERIGERRWRLALPYPRFGSALDLIELAPA